MITIESPSDLTLYFSFPTSQKRVYGVFDGLSIASWHLTRARAVIASKGLPVQIIYKSLRG